MSDLADYLDRARAGYSMAKLRPSPEWRCRELRREFGAPLPKSFVELQHTMGEGAGRLLSDASVYDASHIAWLYGIRAIRTPRRYLFALGDPSLASQPYWLDLERPVAGAEEGDDCEVVRFHHFHEGPPPAVDRVFVGLREMLFFRAAVRVHLPRYPHRARLVSEAPPSGPSSLPLLERIVTAMGFVPSPHLTRCRLYERDGAMIVVYRAPDAEPYSVRAGFADRRALARFRAILRDYSRQERGAP